MTNYFVNFLIPVHAGEVAKSLLLREIKGTPVHRSLVTVYLDKAMDLLPIFLVLMLSPFIDEKLSRIIYLVSGISLLVILIVMIFVICLVRKKDTVLGWVERGLFFLSDNLKMKLKNFSELFVEGLSSMRQLSEKVPMIMGLTILSLLIHCFFLWLFFYSFGINLPVFTVLVSYVLLNASFILPAPPGFTGSLELMFLFIFSVLYNYDKNLVSAVAASSHILIGILFVMFGLLSLALIGSGLSSVLKSAELNRIELGGVSRNSEIGRISDNKAVSEEN
jgi:uncharacterized protein (TIRG00374 family)